MQFTKAPETVTATLTGTSDVSVVNTPDVNIPLPVDVTGSGVAITNVPNVGVPGGVAVTNTPNVGVPTAGTTLQPTGMPTFVGRNVDAQAAASLTISNTSAGTTLIAAPGVGKAIELHAGLTTLSAIPAGAGTPSLLVQLQRSDTGAVIWGAFIEPPGTTPATNVQIPFDFQGATLPLNVGLLLVVASGALSSDQVIMNINYSVVQ